jgi:ParB/RepB/Spo0J family partition protein
MTLKHIAVNAVKYECNRTYGGHGDIDSLTESIKKVGLINPIRVYEQEGFFVLIAGRRRIEAVKKLGWDAIPAIVEDTDDTAETEIALAENVNRLEMHPLDEAAAFKKMLDSGVAIAEVAARYDRSVSGIYQRARLTRLVDEIKDWFRAGKITLSMAAALSSLDEEQQRQFYQEKKKASSFSAYHINEFLQRIQHCRLESWFMDKSCETCKSRTYNTDPQLFDDYKVYKDVCFNESCWMDHWKMYLGKNIGTVREQHPETAAAHILLIQGYGYGIPFFIDEAVQNQDPLNILGEEYTVKNRFDFTQVEDSRINGTFNAFIASFESTGILFSTGLFVSDLNKSNDNYLEQSPRKGIPIEDYLEQSNRNQEVKEALDKKYASEWKFRETLNERILDTYIRQEGASGKKPPQRIINQWFADLYQLINKNRLKTLFLAYTGTKFSSYSKAFNNFSAAEVFFVLSASTIEVSDMPDKSEDPEEFKSNKFIALSGMNQEEYLALYQSAMEELIADAQTGGDKQ